jgi:hypothetical protein
MGSQTVNGSEVSNVSEPDTTTAERPGLARATTAPLVAATHTAPVKFGTLEVDSYVLPDGTAVLSTRGIVRLLFGVNTGGLERFLARIPNGSELFSSVSEVRFRAPGINAPVHGHRADFLVDACNLYVGAFFRGELHPKQAPIAGRAQVILAACAKVGLTGLIYEAAGYRPVNAETVLRDKLAAVLMAEAGRWKQLFTHEFFRELARLHRLTLDPTGRRRPGCFAAFLSMQFNAAFRGTGLQLALGTA